LQRVDRVHLALQHVLDGVGRVEARCYGAAGGFDGGNGRGRGTGDGDVDGGFKEGCALK
jgi:hypothetical protein